MELQTHFASAKLSDDELLFYELEVLKGNSIIEELMRSVGGLFAVLDENRQIISLNHSFLDMLGLKELRDVLGLRLGQGLGCIHATEMEGGCGTSEYCSTCGAAIAMVSALAKDEPIEKMCAVKVCKGDTQFDLFFNVRTSPIELEGRKFILLFMRDITKEQRIASFDRVFLHDVNNIATGLSGCSELLARAAGEKKEFLINQMDIIVQMLVNEIGAHRVLFDEKEQSYHPFWAEIPIKSFVDDIKSFSLGIADAKKIEFLVSGEIPNTTINSDKSLLSRVVCNMVKNAIEASNDNDTVKFSIDLSSNNISFSVWNNSVIPEDIQKRIFQKNFSTKEDIGRGLGTYSMKLFGEDILKGKVDFTSNPKSGTNFTFTINI